MELQNNWNAHSGISKSLHIITLNVNCLNLSVKRHRVSRWIKNKTQLYISKGWKNIFHASRNQKKAEVVIFVLHEIDSKPKMVMRQRRSLYNDKGINSSRSGNKCNYMCT